LRAQAAGFDTVRIAELSIDSRADTAIAIRLTPSGGIHTLPPMTVTAGRSDAFYKPLSPLRISREALLNTAGTANDLNRILAVTPGITSHGTIEDNGLSVRGGLRNENAYRIDGIELDDINHFSTLKRTGGAIGFVPVALLRSLDLYLGGVPASMPSRSSAVVDIALRDGSSDSVVRRLDLDISGIGTEVSGGTSGGRFAYLANGRWNDMRFLQRFMTEGIPYFGDGLGKLTFTISDHLTLSAVGIASYDFLSTPPIWLPRPDSQLYVKELRQGAFGVSSTFVSAHLRNVAGISLVATDDHESLDSSFIRHYWSSGPKVAPETRRVFTFDNNRSRWTLREDFSFFPDNRYRFETGGMIRRIVDNPADQEDYGYFSYTRDTSFGWTQAGGYLQGSIDAGSVTMLAGVRAEYFSLISDYGISPQLGVAIDRGGAGTITLSGGLAHDLPPDLAGSLGGILFHEVWDGTSYRLDEFTLQRCWQGVLGYDRPLGPLHAMKVETYFKWYDQEYPFVYPSGKHYTAAIDTVNGQLIRKLIFPDGKKRSMGIELTLRRSIAGAWHYTWCAAISSVQNRYLNGRWYDDPNDVGATSTLLLGRSLGDHHHLSVRFSASQGRPAIASADDTSGVYYVGRFFPLYSLNFRYGCAYRWRQVKLGAYIEVLNALNQTPFVYQEIFNDRPLLNQRMNGILPMAGLWLEF
jgi:hypothetical protein